jgi:hypothetical protein
MRSLKRHSLAIALIAAIQSTLNMGGQTQIVERPGHGRIVRNTPNVNNAKKGKAHAKNQSPERLQAAMTRRARKGKARRSSYVACLANYYREPLKARV